MKKQLGDSQLNVEYTLMTVHYDTIIGSSISQYCCLAATLELEGKYISAKSSHNNIGYNLHGTLCTMRVTGDSKLRAKH